MRNLLKWAGALALALAPACALSGPAAAQTATKALAPAGYAPISTACVVQPDGSCAASVQSTAQTGAVTSSAATAATGAATFASGTAKVGPFLPTVGYAIRLKLTGTWAGTAYLGTSTDACASVSPLTAGGSAITYSGNLNEIVDAPATTGSDVYCLVATVTSGTLGYALRQ